MATRQSLYDLFQNRNSGPSDGTLIDQEQPNMFGGARDSRAGFESSMTGGTLRDVLSPTGSQVGTGSAGSPYASPSPTDPSTWARPMGGAGSTGVVPPLPGDPVGQPGYTPPTTPGSAPGGAQPMGGFTPPPTNPNRFSPGVSDTMRDLPAQGALPPEFQRNYRPDDPYSALDYGLGLPKTSIDPESVMMDPGFKWQQGQLNRALEDAFAAKGRVGSTDYFNTLANQQQKLISDEYNRINTQQWERSMEMNKLLYDRRARENAESYGREFAENERLYGRQKAEDILAYERGFREDARLWDRLQYLTNLGYMATNTSSGV